MEKPKTADEALKSWLLSMRYYGDEDGGGTPYSEMCVEASLLVTLAENEGIPLETLVPDKENRDMVIQFAEAHAEDWNDFLRAGDMDESE